MKKILLFANLFFLLVVSTFAVTRTVTMSGTSFINGTISINVGDVVTWDNNDNMAHTRDVPAHLIQIPYGMQI
jgi:plastocyanin